MATPSRLESLDKQIKQLQARRAAVAARERERERKRDARCKILLGGGLVALVEDGDAEAAAVYRRIRVALGAPAAKAFEGWDGPPIQTTQTSTEEPA